MFKLKINKLYSKLNGVGLLTLLPLIILAIIILFIPKTTSFLWINKFHNLFFDQVFIYVTMLGDGFMWLVLLLFTYFHKKKKSFIVIINFCVSSLIAQSLKRLVFTDMLRPSNLIHAGYSLNFVEGVKVSLFHSFPSGHTTTAFAIAFTLILFVKNKAYTQKFFIITIAFLIGFSRIYLVQHYPIDVIAGAFLGIFSTYTSVFFASMLKKEKQKQAQPVSVLS